VEPPVLTLLTTGSRRHWPDVIVDAELQQLSRWRRRTAVVLVAAARNRRAAAQHSTVGELGGRVVQLVLENVRPEHRQQVRTAAASCSCAPATFYAPTVRG